MADPDLLIEALLECLGVLSDGPPYISQPKELLIAMDKARAYVDRDLDLNVPPPSP